MDEKYKNLASEVFKKTRAMNRIAQSFYHEKISFHDFFVLFNEDLLDLTIILEKFEPGR